MSTHGATPVVFAFAGESQFVLVSGDRKVLSTDAMSGVEKHASGTFKQTQDTGLLCARASRTTGVETCLIGVPVEVVERSSGRPGLAVVLGIATSTSAGCGPTLYTEALRASLLPRLLAEGQSLSDWATQLTSDCQNPDTLTATRAKLDNAALPIATLYTRLLNGYAPGRDRLWSNPPTTEPGLHLANIAVTEMYRSGDVQTAFFAALTDLLRVPDFTERLTHHEVWPNGVFFCAADQPAAKPSRRRRG